MAPSAAWCPEVTASRALTPSHVVTPLPLEGAAAQRENHFMLMDPPPHTCMLKRVSAAFLGHFWPRIVFIRKHWYSKVSDFLHRPPWNRIAWRPQRRRLALDQWSSLQSNRYWWGADASFPSSAWYSLDTKRQYILLSKWQWFSYTRITKGDRCNCWRYSRAYVCEIL